MMKSMPNTIQVGDTTGGATGNPKQFSLFNGWAYNISTWQAASPEGQLIEDHGIAPEIVEHNTEVSFAAGTDLILETAIRTLQ